MNYITFTNNISSDLMQWMEKYSTSKKLTRRAVLEKALTEFRTSVRRKEYADSFQKARIDPEIGNMSKEGLGDYVDQLASLEK